MILLLLLILSSQALAEELPPNFQNLPYNEKTASKWVDEIPPKYEKAYIESQKISDKDGNIVLDSPVKIYGETELFPGFYEITYDVNESSIVKSDLKYRTKEQVDIAKPLGVFDGVIEVVE